jgi:ribosomal protein L37AE/L43A
VPPILNKKPGLSEDTPEKLKPYAFHGVDLQFRGEDKEATATCPFCEAEGKFTVRLDDGRYRCYRCSEGTAKGGGNAYVFVRVLYERSLANTTDRDYEGLGKARGLLPETLKAWGVARSITTGEWLLPGYSPEGTIKNLYRYAKIDGKGRLLSTPGMYHQLFGVPLYDAAKPQVHFCEGPWDGMALWETLRVSKTSVDGLAYTPNEDISLAASTSVLAVPGAAMFYDSWVVMAERKVTYLLYDNDHEKERNGTKVPPVGFEASRRAAGLLLAAKTPAEAIRFLMWGPKGWDPNLPTGYDVRDALAAPTMDERVQKLAQLYDLFEDAPDSWKAEAKASRSAGPALALKPCSDYRQLIMAWRKAMKWTPGLDHALASMLASITSVKSLGSQLWIKVIGPASCGKSTLCEAVSVNRQYVMAKDNIRGFHSGYGEEGEDNSLISRLFDKTLVTKDGDTLLTSAELPRILSEARAIYDRSARTHYRNKKANDYEGVNMTWILCGTSSLRSIDSSELGERFLDCVIMEEIDDDLEDEILLRVAYRTHRNMGVEVNGRPETHNSVELTEAMALTGGYIDFLRKNAQDLLSAIEEDDETIRYCARLGKFVAYMRARPSSRQQETAEREFGARLVEQHYRLAMCLAVVLNKPRIDEEVLARVRRIATDTARGDTLKMARQLYHCGIRGTDGAEIKALAAWTNIEEHRTRHLVSFLRKIGVVENVVQEGRRTTPRVQLTPRFSKLYENVIGDE